MKKELWDLLYEGGCSSVAFWPELGQLGADPNLPTAESTSRRCIGL